MANKREFKKIVNHTAAELFAVCLVQSIFNPATDKKKADEIMTNVLVMQGEVISNISHTQSGKVKGFHKKIRKDFDMKVKEFVEAIEKLCQS